MFVRFCMFCSFVSALFFEGSTARTQLRLSQDSPRVLHDHVLSARACFVAPSCYCVVILCGVSQVVRFFPHYFCRRPQPIAPHTKHTLCFCGALGQRGTRAAPATRPVCCAWASRVCGSAGSLRQRGVLVRVLALPVFVSYISQQQQ